MDLIPVLIAYWMFSDKPRCPACPACHGCHVMKNGFTRHGDQNHMCRECGRQFVENTKQNRISTEVRDQVDKLLLERISLAGIARVTGVSEDWLQDYVNKKYQSVPRQIDVTGTVGKLTIECDEMWSFVMSKKTRNGFGWPLMPRPNKSSVYSSGRVIEKEPKPFGTHYLQFIDNMLFVIQISGHHTRR